jgi:hypothetical protein
MRRRPVNLLDPRELGNPWDSLRDARSRCKPGDRFRRHGPRLHRSVCLGYHPVKGLKELANFGVSFINGVNKITPGWVQLPAPFCGFGLGTAWSRSR